MIYFSISWRFFFLACFKTLSPLSICNLLMYSLYQYKLLLNWRRLYLVSYGSYKIRPYESLVFNLSNNLFIILMNLIIYSHLTISDWLQTLKASKYDTCESERLLANINPNNYKKAMVSYFVFFWLAPKCENAFITKNDICNGLVEV